MLIEPVPASGWLNTNLTPEDRQLLLKSGILPVNDKLLPLYEEDYKILLARGGRGGGKSEGVFDKLIGDCINEKYFKCYYGRKIFETVHGSCFETLVANIEKRGLQSKFKYSTADNSQMVVTHRKTGNKFIPFGADKAEKLKSIKDPTCIVCEEFDQFTFDDFKELYPALRTLRGKNQFYGMFNTHKVYSDHWIIKLFFTHLYTGSDNIGYDAMEGVPLKNIFINYDDNYFIDQEDYYKQLKLACGGNTILLDAVANGEWGMVENESPWLSSYDESKHVRNVPFLPAYPVYLAFDFNNDPFTCTAWQMSPHFGDIGSSFVHCIKEFTGKYKVEDMCDRILQAFPASIIYITGDRSGQNEDIGRHQTLYQMIAAKLKVPKGNLDLNNSNLEHGDSRILCNAMFFNYPNLFIHPSCTTLRKDCQIATIDPKKGASHLLKDREMYKMDSFDSMRYFFQTYFHEFVQKTYLRIIKQKS